MVNTFARYRERRDPLPPGIRSNGLGGAMKVACKWGDNIPIGVIYQNDRLPLGEHVSVLRQGPLVGLDVDG